MSETPVVPAEEAKVMTRAEVVASIAYKNGYRARYEGDKFVDNPYLGIASTTNSDYGEDWSNLWEQGFIDAGRMSKVAWYDGEAAGSKSIAVSECPHDDGTFARAVWMQGHAAGAQGATHLPSLLGPDIGD